MTADLVPLPHPAALLPAEAAGSLVEEFLRAKSRSTQVAYARDLERFARWLVPAAELPELPLLRFLDQPAGAANRAALAYRTALTGQGLAAATVARRIAAVKSWVKFARLVGRVAWSIEIAAPRAEPRRDVRGPNTSEFRRMWKAAKAAGESRRAKRDRAIVALLYGLALRRNELTTLYLSDVDMIGGICSVLAKGHAERLRLTMPREVSRVLAEWLAVRGAEPGPVFVRTDRHTFAELDGESVARVIGRLGVCAGLPRRVRPHGLRHSAITSAIARGETLDDVRRFSRHAKMETVMRYADAHEDRAGQVAARGARLLK